MSIKFGVVRVLHPVQDGKFLVILVVKCFRFASSCTQVLADAARRIEDNTPWYEKLGMRFEESEGVRDVAVETVLAYNVAEGLLDAASETVLAPVFVILKGLLRAVQDAAAARDDILELTAYCVGISSCLLETTRHDMPQHVAMKLGEFEREMEAVCRFVKAYSAQTGCCRRLTRGSHDRSIIANHKSNLEDILNAVVVGVVVDTSRSVNDIQNIVQGRDPPCLSNLADIPLATPSLPRFKVERTALVESVVQGLLDDQRNASRTICLWGMGGGGKTVLASSVVHDERVRSSFRQGIFWLCSTHACKGGIRLMMEHLVHELAKAPSAVPHHCPHRTDSAEEASRHLSEVLTRRKLRCLVVLDNVWDVEAIGTLARTGFHILVTTRKKTVIPVEYRGVIVEVGDMEEVEGLELLRKASGAHGPLPAEARQVHKQAHATLILSFTCMVSGKCQNALTKY